MNNKYYDLFINEEVDENLLNEKPVSFEDHFWHLLALSVLYKKQGDEYLEKTCLQKACDLNYAYNAMIYFEKKEVLPPNYKQYLTEFTNQMKDDKVEERIKYYNKRSANKKNLGFLWYSLISLSIIPVMLFLVFVCKLETTIAAIIAIVLMFGGQFLFTRMQKRNRYMKVRPLEKRLENHLKYYDRFAKLFQNELYIDLIRTKDGSEQEKEIVEKLKRGDK